MADQDLGHAFFVLLVLLCILSYITVSVRCFVRIKILRTFGADDWLLIVSLVGQHGNEESKRSNPLNCTRLYLLSWQACISPAYIMASEGQLPL